MKRIPFLFLLSFASIFILGGCTSETGTPSKPALIVENPIIMNTPTFIIGCSVKFAEAEPTSAPSSASLIPPVSAADFSLGPADAPVTLVEYCEFQSQGCAGMANVVMELLKNHANLRFVFRPLPLIGILDKSDRAVLAALAADEQGQFWVMYDILFTKYNEWADLSPSEFNAWVVRIAADAGMDGDQLTAATKSDKTTTRMMSMYEAAKQLSIPAVPLVLINGKLQQSYVLDYQNMSDTIGLITLGQKQYTECPPFNIDPLKQYIATIKTDKGDIVIGLFPDKAPLAVNSFVFLARAGWFDGVTFHRVIPGFAAQTGDPSGTGRGNPGYLFNNEFSDLKFDKPGRIGMANSGLDTNGSQFFITFAPAPQLDSGYTIFGQVLKGLDVAEQLTPREPGQVPLLPPGGQIISVTIEEK